MANSDWRRFEWRLPSSATCGWSRGRSLENAEVVDRVEPDCSGARCIVPGVATEPCTEGQVVGRRWSTRFEQRPSIAGRSPGNRRVDECEKLRSAGCPRVWICGRHLAGVEYAGKRSIKNGDVEGLRTRVAGAVHGCPDHSWESHVCCDRCSRRQAEASRRKRALSSPSTLKTRCRV